MTHHKTHTQHRPINPLSLFASKFIFHPIPHFGGGGGGGVWEENIENRCSDVNFGVFWASSMFQLTIIISCPVYFISNCYILHDILLLVRGGGGPRNLPPLLYEALKRDKNK